MSEQDDIIQVRLKLLDNYMVELRRLQPTEFPEYVSNYLIRRTVERDLQTAIEACLDIGRHLIAKEGFRYPEDNADVFRILAEEKVISSELLSRLENMAGFRNVLVHEYADLDDKKVYRNFKDQLGDFDEYANAIVAYLSRPAIKDEKKSETGSDKEKKIGERKAQYTPRPRQRKTKKHHA